MSATLHRLGANPSKTRGPHIAGMRGLVGDAELPDAVSLASLAGSVADQGETSSCVGQAMARAIAIRQAFIGAPVPWPSPVCIYTQARVFARGQTPVGLVPLALADDGCAIDEAIAGATQFGVASNAAWPFDPSTINAEPQLVQLESDACCKVATGYSIPVDTSAGNAVERSLASGCPVVRCGPCGAETQSYPGGDAIIGPCVVSGGGHATCVVGYDYLGPDGSMRLLVINSWGVGWGNEGYFFANLAWLLDSTDLWVVETATTKEAS